MELELRDLVPGKKYFMSTEGVVIYLGRCENGAYFGGITDSRYRRQEEDQNYPGSVPFGVDAIAYLHLTEIKISNWRLWIRDLKRSLRRLIFLK